VFYDPPASAEAARRVGEAAERGFPGGVRRYRMLVGRDANGDFVSFFDGRHLDDGTYRLLGALLSREAFDGRAIEVRVCPNLEFLPARVLVIPGEVR